LEHFAGFEYSWWLAVVGSDGWCAWWLLLVVYSGTSSVER